MEGKLVDSEMDGYKDWRHDMTAVDSLLAGDQTAAFLAFLRFTVQSFEDGGRQLERMREGVARGGMLTWGSLLCLSFIRARALFSLSDTLFNCGSTSKRCFLACAVTVT